MGLKWLVPLIGTLDVIGMWFGEDQRADIIKTYVQMRLDLCLQISIITLHLMMNIIGRIYVSS